MFKVGDKKPVGSGIKKGGSHKTTKLTKELIVKLLEGNWHKVNSSLAYVFDDDPARALDIVVKLAEYALPKLARTVDKDGNDVKTSITVTFVDERRATDSV